MLLKKADQVLIYRKGRRQKSEEKNRTNRSCKDEWRKNAQKIDADNHWIKKYQRLKKKREKNSQTTFAIALVYEYLKGGKALDNTVPIKVILCPSHPSSCNMSKNKNNRQDYRTSCGRSIIDNPVSRPQISSFRRAGTYDATLRLATAAERWFDC